MILTRPRVFTTFEVARICAVFHTTVINWVNKGRLKAHHTPGGHRRIKAADLVDFMQRYEMPIPADLAGRPKRILIVEDDPEVQLMLKRALQPLPGVVIQECADGLEALMAIGKEAPDLLILDIRIPQVNGVGVCRLLKANENTQPIRIIAVTGEPLPSETTVFLKEHADGFFQKPLATAALRALAAELLDLEAAALAASFNRMADSLKGRTEDLMRRVRELSSLQRMNDAALRQLGKDAIGAACLEAAVTGLGYEKGMLFWVDHLRGEVVGACGKGMEGVGLTDAEVRRRRVPLDGNDVAALAARGREPVLVADPRTDPRCDQEFVRRTDAKPFCVVPVVARDKVIAVLGLSQPLSGEPIAGPELRGLALFAGAAGLALENAELLGAVTSSEERYRTAVENSPHAVVGLDQNYRITLWNRRAQALFGYSPVEAAGRDLSVVFGEEAYRRLLRRVETEGSLQQAEAAGKSRDGRSLELSLSWTGQDAGPQGAREWFVVLEDETEKKRLQAHLVQTEKMGAVGSLIAGVAHELNNPLAAVTGLAEHFLTLPLGPEEKQDLKALHKSAMRCKDIVQGLLLFVRKGKPARERLSLNFVVQSTLSLFEYRMAKVEDIELHVELDPAGPSVAGTFQQLQQVFVNILSNACDALSGRRVPRVVRVRTRPCQGGCAVEFEDNGPGVPAGLRPSLFEPFVTTKPAGQGTGLGLSISKQLVEEHGGRMRCEEGPEGGARFVVEFPPCPEGLPEPDAVLKLPPSMPGRRVLVVDDEPELAQLMVRLLAEDGLVASAETACAAALAKVEAGGFDLLVTDIDLGPLKGTRLLEAARALPGKPAVILVTGDVLNQELCRELATLSVPVLNKPFLRSEFLRLVRGVLQTRYSVRT